MNRALLLLTALLLSCQGALAQSGGQKAWDETLKAARQEGKVVVAGPPDTQVRQTLPAAFEARYGIKMEYVTGRGSDQAAKLRREREAGLYTTDAVLAGSQTMFTVLHREKMLAPLKPELILPEVTDGRNWLRGSLWFPDPEQQDCIRGSWRNRIITTYSCPDLARLIPLFQIFRGSRSVWQSNWVNFDQRQTERPIALKSSWQEEVVNTLISSICEKPYP